MPTKVKIIWIKAPNGIDADKFMICPKIPGLSRYYAADDQCYNIITVTRLLTQFGYEWSF